jgi:hypothetical protein
MASRMRKFLLATFIAGFIAWFCPQQEVKAFDPVTLSLLAPVAMEAASTATPYIIKWFSGVGSVMLKMGKDICEVFLLPIGLMELIFVAPFYTSCFKQSLRFMLKGSIAPFKLCFHTLLLPLAFFGISFR